MQIPNLLWMLGISSSLSFASPGVFTQKCFQCHGKDGADLGGFGSILDTSGLIRQKIVIPGDSKNSLLFQKVSSGEMPMNPRLTKEQRKLSALELESIKDWIDKTLAPKRAGFTPRKRISETQVLTSIRLDLSHRSLRDQLFQRYFTLNHLANQGVSQDKIGDTKAALLRLINSLSWNPNLITALNPIDSDSLILRLDLRDAYWDESTWNEITKAYPFAEAQAAVVESDELTKYTSLYVRADWFVSGASQAPLYYQVLKLPNHVRDLGNLLEVHLDDEVRLRGVVRAGFSRSQVSRNNRIIERHSSRTGYFWTSYDFADNLGEHNIFTHPIGPDHSDVVVSDRDYAFRPSGGEMIFSLPNGLQAYFVTNAVGKRIDQASTTIVSDTSRPDRAVTAGVSCFRCHGQVGMNLAEDQMREVLSANLETFPIQVREEIASLYPGKAVIKSWLNKDALKYVDALKQIENGNLSTAEPISSTSLAFEALVDMNQGAAELGYTPDQLASKIRANSELGVIFGPWLIPGGTISREAFIELLPRAVRELKSLSQVRY